MSIGFCRFKKKIRQKKTDRFEKVGEKLLKLSLSCSYVYYIFVDLNLNFIPRPHITNWATIVLGIVITDLEVGFIFAYKAGWKVSTLATVSNAALAVILIFVGLIGYHEQMNWSKILGVLFCLVGLYFINKK